MKLTVLFAVVCIFANVKSGILKNHATNLNGRAEKDVKDEFSTKDHCIQRRDLEKNDSKLSNLQNFLLQSIKSTVQPTNIKQCHSEIDDLKLEVLLLTSANIVLKKQIEGKDTGNVDMEKCKTENKNLKAELNSKTQLCQCQKSEDRNNGEKDVEKDKLRTNFAAEKLSALNQTEISNANTHISDLVEKNQNLTAIYLLSQEKILDCKSKTDILSKSLNNSHDHLVACQEIRSKTIQDKDLEIKTQNSEITNLRKELAEHNSTLQQINECHVSKDRINREKDEEIKQSKTEIEKLKTGQNSTLFQLNECITSKNKTILEKNMEIENKLSEISKLKTELAAEKNLTHQRRDCLNGNQSSQRSRELYEAAEKGRTAELLSLLEDCENPNGIWGERDSALSIASRNGRIEAVTALIKYGANVNHADKYGWTPLMEAAQEGHVQVVKLLLAHKARVNDVNMNERSATQWAAYNGHVEVLKELIVAGGDVASVDVNGWTALSHAALNGNRQNEAIIVDILKAAGATQ